MIDLSGRVVIVTGGDSGIGLGIARGVAWAGASVAVWSRRHERNLAAVAELKRLGATAIGVQYDVSDEDNVAGRWGVPASIRALRAVSGTVGAGAVRALAHDVPAAW